MVPVWAVTRPPPITGECQSPWSSGTHPITQAETAGVGRWDSSPGPPTTQTRPFPTLVTWTGYPHALLLEIRNPQFIPKAPSLIHVLSVSWKTAKVLGQVGQPSSTW